MGGRSARVVRAGMQVPATSSLVSGGLTGPVLFACWQTSRRCFVPGDPLQALAPTNSFCICQLLHVRTFVYLVAAP